MHGKAPCHTAWPVSELLSADFVETPRKLEIPLTSFDRERLAPVEKNRIVCMVMFLRRMACYDIQLLVVFLLSSLQKRLRYFDLLDIVMFVGTQACLW